MRSGLRFAAGAGFYLAQKPVYRAHPGPGVRVGDPGSNLVGRGWTGDPTLTDIGKAREEAAKAASKDEG